MYFFLYLFIYGCISIFIRILCMSASISTCICVQISLVIWVLIYEWSNSTVDLWANGQNSRSCIIYSVHTIHQPPGRIYMTLQPPHCQINRIWSRTSNPAPPITKATITFMLSLWKIIYKPYVVRLFTLNHYELHVFMCPCGLCWSSISYAMYPIHQIFFRYYFAKSLICSFIQTTVFILYL